jgi:hypothetical protein
VRRAYQSDTDVANIGFEAAVQFVAILDGAIAVLLALLQIIEIYLDIGEKPRKRSLRSLARRQKRSEQMERIN